MSVPNMNAKLRQILVITDGDGYRVLDYRFGHRFVGKRGSDENNWYIGVKLEPLVAALRRTPRPPN